MKLRTLSQFTVIYDYLCSDAVVHAHLDIKSLIGGSLLSGSSSEKSTFIIRPARCLRLLSVVQSGDNSYNYPCAEIGFGTGIWASLALSS